MDQHSSAPPDPFSDPQSVARYKEGPPRIVPGFADMQRMTTLLLSERVPQKGRVLVVGAGGGLELQAFAQAHPGWTFDGVDPSAEMIRLAEQTLGPLLSRVRLYPGEVDMAPDGPFDAATCLLTMHFVERKKRQRMAVEIRSRLRPGSPFVVVHMSIPDYEDEKARAHWLSRYAAFAVSSGVDPRNVDTARTTMESRLNILTPEHDEAILHEAGFSNINLFYAGFTFRGWVAYA
ncbi:class I SAM-dependent methyltransferase [Gimesia maris]|uniref:class I SAM-dependent methyltransferase n=1 Tax=Gimesia maris TaxID=122 RepID=UPI003A8DB592